MPKTKHSEHGEIKKTVSMSLTQTSIKGLDRQAQELGVSRSEFIELIGRGLVNSNPNVQLLGEF